MAAIWYKDYRWATAEGSSGPWLKVSQGISWRGDHCQGSSDPLSALSKLRITGGPLPKVPVAPERIKFLIKFSAQATTRLQKKIWFSSVIKRPLGCQRLAIVEAKNLIITPRKNKSPTHPNPGANVGYVDENFPRSAQKMAFSCERIKVLHITSRSVAG